LALDQLAQRHNDAAMRPVEQFAANVRARRIAAGLSQEQLSRLTDLHPTEISRLERAVREPRLSTIVRVARALDITPAELLERVR
jgi:transcriptional regulator with XRE-family HTH domain